MIYITGDMHGPLSAAKFQRDNFPAGAELTRGDYVIVTGDYGLFFFSEPDDEFKKWLKFFDEAPWTTLFIDGNHENFDILGKLQRVPMFGGTVGKYSDSVYHLRRGEIYAIEEKTFFCMGGAQSIDIKTHTTILPNGKKMAGRLEGYNWWRQEVPSHAEMDRGIENLERHGNSVDYILSHAPSRRALKALIEIALDSNVQFYQDVIHDPTVDYIDHVCSSVDFKKALCGHMHIDWEWEEFRFLFDDIVPL